MFNLHTIQYGIKTEGKNIDKIFHITYKRAGEPEIPKYENAVVYKTDGNT